MTEKKNGHQRSPCKVRRHIPIQIAGGHATLHSFDGLEDPREHIALCFGDWDKQSSPLVRIHSECLTGDVFGSARCDCGNQLSEAIGRFHKTGGILLYLRQEGRDIGLYNKIDAYALQDKGYDTFEANHRLGLPCDARAYLVAAQMLQALQVSRIRLLSNNPDKREQLIHHGITIIDQLPTETHLTAHNKRYLQAKCIKAGHTLNMRRIS